MSPNTESFLLKISSEIKENSQFPPVHVRFLVWSACASESNSEVLKSLFVRDKSALDAATEQSPWQILGKEKCTNQRGQRVYLGSYVHTITSFTQEETEQLKDFSNSFGLIDGFLEMVTKQQVQTMVFVQACALKFFYSTTPPHVLCPWSRTTQKPSAIWNIFNVLKWAQNRSITYKNILEQILLRNCE